MQQKQRRRRRGGEDARGQSLEFPHLSERRESPDRLWEFFTERQAKQPVCRVALPFPWTLDVPFTGTNRYIRKPAMPGCAMAYSTELHSDSHTLPGSLQVKKKK